MRIRELFEDQQENEKHVTFCFGRMNPPTVGHKQVFKTMKSQGGDFYIFVSQTQDPKKNPLSYDDKVDFIRKIHKPYANNVVEDPNLNTVFKVATSLYDKGYTHATFVGGDDRKGLYEQLKKYNGSEGPHGYYKFETLEFESSGSREDDAPGLAGISATKAREAAAKGDLKEFIKTTGAGDVAEELYAAVRKGMGIQEKQKEKDDGQESEENQAA